jgi:hypothetical protein
MGDKNDHWLQGSNSKLQLKNTIFEEQIFDLENSKHTSTVSASWLLGRLNKNAVESVVDGILCASFQNPGSDFACANMFHLRQL